MKKLLLATSLLINILAFSQPKQLTSEQLRRADSIVKSNINFESIELELISLINAYRLTLKLDTLVYDTNVQKAAKFQIDYNISINKLTHSNINLLSDVSARVEKFTKIHPTTSGEVLASTSPLWVVSENRTIAESILEMWKSSPSHNTILTFPKMKSIGVSVNRKDKKSGAIFAGAVLVVL
jgi:uncharacterized protein YkwD